MRDGKKSPKINSTDKVRVRKYFKQVQWVLYE